MNKQMIIGALLGGAVATAGGAIAFRDASPKEAKIVSVTPITKAMEQQYVTVSSVQQVLDPNAPKLAQVTSVEPIVQRGQTREVCENQVVTRQAPVKDQNQIAGTALGAVIGGALGNQVGGGNGKKLATVAGVIAGGVVGKNVQANRQQQQTYQTTEQVCNTVKAEDRTTGYNVSLNVNGQPQYVTMSYRPSGELPVMNGVVVTDKAQIKQVMSNIKPPVYDVFYDHNDKRYQMTLDYAPSVGTRFPLNQGMVLTSAEDIAAIQAQANDVVAYKVLYQTKDGVGELRTLQQPYGDTLQLEKGKPVLTNASL